MIALRSFVFNTLFYATTVVLMIVGLPTLLSGRPTILRLARLWGRVSLFYLRVVCGMRVEFRGTANIPPGGSIIAAKHQSFLETFALLAFLPDFTIILKRELTLIPLFGQYLVRSGMIAIDRKRGASALTRLSTDAREACAIGRQILIFPEGTRRPPGAPPDYKSGTALLYSATRAPCVPVALDTGLFWGRRSFLRRPGTVLIEFLPPIEPGLGKAAFLALLQERLETATDRLIAESLTAQPELRVVLDQGRLEPAGAGEP